MNLVIYTDGGCSGNKRDAGCPGAWAYVVVDVGGNIIDKLSGREENVTNNQMELKAVIMALRHQVMDCGNGLVSIKVISDSRYVVDNYNEYIEEWEHRNWRKSTGGVVINVEFWKELRRLSKYFKSFTLEWVKGHSTNKLNQKVDEMVRSHLYKD